MLINIKARAVFKWVAALWLMSWIYGCQSSSAPEGYELVWADEFDCESRLSETDWGYETGFVRNREAQWYQPDNAYCQDGYLVLEAKRQQVLNPDFEPDSHNWRKQTQYAEFTSASVNTKGKHSWQYGVFEIRAKILAEQGLWPAIWFLGIEGQWPSNGEIDLMEYYRDTILANVAWADKGQYKAIWNAKKYPMSNFDDPNWDQKFHTWKMQWDKDFIRLYLDEELLNEVSLTDTINRSDSHIINPFHQPHYLLLNLAVGGQQGGDISQTRFPSKYLIDYVRVYQRPRNNNKQN